MSANSCIFSPKTSLLIIPESAYETSNTPVHQECFISDTPPSTCNKYFPGTQGKKEIYHKERNFPLSSRVKKKLRSPSSLGESQVMSSPSLTLGKLRGFKLAK